MFKAMIKNFVSLETRKIILIINFQLHDGKLKKISIICRDTRLKVAARLQDAVFLLDTESFSE